MAGVATTWRRALLLAALSVAPSADAFWRLKCSVIQTGRVDPIVSPGAIAGHAHKVSGASSFGFGSTFDSLRASQCTSCEVGADKSAYWTPQLYYQHANGSFQEVPNGGTVVYYLGRGENRSNIEPFPPGFKMLSGNASARSLDNTSMTYSNATARVSGRPVSDRVSFACLDSRSGPLAEQRYMFRTDCDNGLRAQLHFPSCWDGGPYQADQSHVAYMSQIDNGVCPPSHPRQLIDLFFEVLYSVNSIDKSKGGRFVFSNGDATGYGFHGDFMNGWDDSVLRSAIAQCVNNDTLNGVVENCPPLAASQTPYFATNCPERPPLVDEPVHGMLAKLPGCNNVTSGPDRAVQQTCPTQPRMLPAPVSSGPNTMFEPSPGAKLSSTSTWTYAGCAADNRNNSRLLTAYTFTADNMTIDLCTSTCKARGYPLAGLEFSRECYCSTTLSSSSLSPPTTCTTTPKMICPGNSTQWCGAPGLLTIWNDTSHQPPPRTAASGTATYLGCFLDTGRPARLLSKQSYANGSVSVDQCVRFCQAGNYALAGVEYGGECYCGGDGGWSLSSTGAPAAVPADESSCNMPCRGNTAQLCGGASRIGVWNNTLYTPTRNPSPVVVLVAQKPVSYSYIGCYSDTSSAGRALGKGARTGSSSSSTSSSMADAKSLTVESCAAFCARGGFAYMGVEWAQECYCNSDGPTNGAARVPEGECAVMTCKGDVAEWCGAGGRVGVYKVVGK